MTPFVDLHTHSASSDDNVVSVVNLAAAEKPCTDGLHSIGIHPWRLDDSSFDADRAFAALEPLLADRRIVALGETGLDRAHRATLERQTALFERHIALSESAKLPVIIHNVHCTNDLMALRKRFSPSQLWVVHGFAGGLDEARQLIDHGFMLSVGSALLDDRRKIFKALPEIGTENLFFETDTSDISIIKVYEKAARLLSMPVSALREDVWGRFADVFSRC